MLFRSKKMILSICIIVISLLLIINVFKHAYNPDNSVGFTALLDWLSSFKPLTIDFNINSLIVESSWGILDFLRVTFNGLVSSLNFVIFIITQLLNLITFVFQFVVFLFV